MKSWKLYVLCLACVCCMAFLTGCGNDNTANGTENNVTTTEQNSEAETAKPDTMNQNADPQENMSGDVLDGTDSDNNGIGTDGSVIGDMTEGTDGDMDGTVNSVTDENSTDEPADTLEKAGRDLADDVDDALTGQNY